jgi:hypothetical protein
LDFERTAQIQHRSVSLLAVQHDIGVPRREAEKTQKRQTIPISSFLGTLQLCLLNQAKYQSSRLLCYPADLFQTTTSTFNIEVLLQQPSCMERIQPDFKWSAGCRQSLLINPCTTGPRCAYSFKHAGILPVPFPAGRSPPC